MKRSFPFLVALIATCLAASAALAVTNVNYYGGRVLSKVQVVLVYWGTGVDSTITSNLPGFYDDVTASPYIDWLQEYDTVEKVGFSDGLPGSDQRIRRGTFVGAFTITPSITGSSVTDAQIQAELAQQIADGHLPPIATDGAGNANSYYVVVFPSGKTITGPTGSTSCVQFCSYHETTTINGHNVPYGVLPYQGPGTGCASGCGTGTYLQNVTMNHAHTLLEAITDTEIGLATVVGRPVAWYNPTAGQGEIGDICNGQQATLTINTHTWTVQKGWSNALQSCVTNNPAATPTPDTTLPPTTTTTLPEETTTTTLPSNPSFGGDDTGYLPPAKSDLLKCENGVAKAMGKLMAATMKCHVARASGKLADHAAEEACEAAASAKFTGKVKTDGCGMCTDVAAIAQAAVAAADGANGLAYCQQ